MTITIPGATETFLQEAQDLLDQIEEAALQLETRPGDGELVNRLFRAFHTIKGSAGLIGLERVSAFTHHVESALDRVREGRLRVEPKLVSLILSSRDHIESLLHSEPSAAPAVERAGDPIVQELKALSHASLAVFPRISAAAPPRISAAAPPQTSEPFAGLFLDDGGELAVELPIASTRAGPPSGRSPSLRARAMPRFSQRPRPAAVEHKVARAQSAVRVPSERLDQLVSLVGELVINQSRLNQALVQAGATEMVAPVEAMERLISDLRDSVLRIRMMPIGATFSRFQRLVHDLSAELGKEVDLVTEGEDTELDKTVIDQLGDPLVHLIRNSLDHGIEAPDDRIAKGKSARGTLRLCAAHEGASVVITIADDGKGLDRARIRARAEEKGLIAPDAHLSNQEIFDLVMRPGFSTAAAVTNISGRGVGLDVVKRTIEGLRGAINFSSAPAEGTTVRLSLPLTLAIIDGLLVEIDDDKFIIPMAAVTENVELTRAERQTNNGRNLLAVRGELVPYLRLRDVFSVNTPEGAIEKVVIVTVSGQRLGLVVDRVIGSHQTVIQPLGRFYRGVDLFSGTTIMGDGRVAMILELAGIARRVAREGCGRAA